MKRVITYGTFDLLHYGHINLLRRAKELGDYLVVVLSTDEFNWNEKQKKLSVSKLKGAWMPATEQRVFRVKVLWPQADGRVITKEKQVAYQGQSLVISIE